MPPPGLSWVLSTNSMAGEESDSAVWCLTRGVPDDVAIKGSIELVPPVAQVDQPLSQDPAKPKEDGEYPDSDASMLSKKETHPQRCSQTC